MARFLSMFLLLVVLASAAEAQTPEPQRILLVNGDVYVGVVIDGDSDPIVVRSSDGIERRFARDQVADILPLINGRFYRTDPVRTRFFIAPTARTLGGGEFRGVRGENGHTLIAFIVYALRIDDHRQPSLFRAGDHRKQQRASNCSLGVVGQHNSCHIIQCSFRRHS